MEVNDLKDFLMFDKITINVPVRAISEYVELFKILGFKETSSETNGWQVDFWYTFTNQNFDFNLILSGCLYSGNYQLLKELNND